MVQLGGLEPPTSWSTARRSNQLSYSCIGSPQATDWAAAMQAGPGAGGGRRPKTKSPAMAGLLTCRQRAGLRYAAKLHCMFRVFETPALIGPAVSVATFWASAESVFACAESDSNCLRMWLAESSTASASDFEPKSSRV